MFNLRVRSFLAISILVLGAAVASSAQIASGSVIRADIPSAFVVMDKTFPAGKYTIERTPGSFDSTTLLVLRGEKSEAIIFDTIPAASDQAATETGLVFENVGGVEHLSKIVVRGESVVFELPKNKAEVRTFAKSATDQKVNVVQNPGF